MFYDNLCIFAAGFCNGGVRKFFQPNIIRQFLFNILMVIATRSFTIFKWA